MLKTQTKALALLAMVGLVCTAAPSVTKAQEVLDNEPVSLTVNNGFTLARTTAMNFGTYAVVADAAGANTATLTMAAATGVATPANTAPASFTSVSATGRTQGVYAISGAAPNTDMTVTLNDLQNLTCTACAGGTPVITLTSVTADDATPTTSGGGTATVNVGAVLTTVAGGGQYVDGTYSGSFDITVAY